MIVLSAQSMVGKTITKVDDSCVNMTILHFSDGTSIILEAEHYNVSAGMLTIGFYNDTPETETKPKRKPKNSG